MVQKKLIDTCSIAENQPKETYQYRGTERLQRCPVEKSFVADLAEEMCLGAGNACQDSCSKTHTYEPAEKGRCGGFEKRKKVGPAKLQMIPSHGCAPIANIGKNMLWTAPISNTMRKQLTGSWKTGMKPEERKGNWAVHGKRSRSRKRESNWPVHGKRS